jgi:hypothetical protein
MEKFNEYYKVDFPEDNYKEFKIIPCHQEFNVPESERKVNKSFKLKVEE